MSRKIGILLFILLSCFALVVAAVTAGQEEEAGISGREASGLERIPPGFHLLGKEAFSCGGTAHTLEIYRHEGTGLEFVLVPGGSFTMGSPRGEEGRYYWEGPEHRVAIEPFLICRTEVSQAVWQKIMGTAPWKGDGKSREGPDYPASGMNWEECVSFCRKAGLRLPSESEWEYACRGGIHEPFCFGDSHSDLGDYAWYEDNSSNAGEDHPHETGRKKPNAFGLFDMHGNVWEWCQDRWHGDYGGAPPDGSAWESWAPLPDQMQLPTMRYVDPSPKWILRGGGWYNGAGECRSASRRYGISDHTYVKGQGFRPACSLVTSGCGEEKHAATEPDPFDPLKIPPGFKFLVRQTFSCGGQSNTVDLFVHVKTGMEFVLLPGGAFAMGSPAGDLERYDNEAPMHVVTIAPFLLCRTECTQAAWDRIGGDDQREWINFKLPIDGVDWNDCTAWCEKAGLRLPSEAEWEYACRAGSSTPRYFGPSGLDLGEHAWYSENAADSENAERCPHPVGTKKPNAFGLYDLYGNVWEWCEDSWHEDYIEAPADGSAWVDLEPLRRVDRGGGFESSAEDCRSANRGAHRPDLCYSAQSFRPACSLK